MRLLTYREDGEIMVTSDEADERKLPPYAILSHRWGTDEEEVTFKDLQENTGKKKLGYRKIQLCGKQTKRDGLQHFWVDTCCIDKANKAELTLAIRSMFRWYRNAGQCYVYLADVSASSAGAKEKVGTPLWDSEFRGSQWFTRGWTLQELLAPRVVEFFSRDWHRLGDRESLKTQIHQVTAIQYSALEGTPLPQFSVEERFRWSQDRKTKLEEDAAYCLSGIFGIDMAPVYGEGVLQAHGRLRNGIQKQEECLRDLHLTDPRKDKERIEETKGGLLSDSYSWVLNNYTFQQWQQDPHDRLLWVRGDPGKGKTMLLCGIINELQSSLPKNALLAYFFSQATDSRINSATAVLRGLLYMLLRQQPALVSHVREKHAYAGKTMFEDANAWVTLTEVFVNVLQDPGLSTTYLVIDALDECVSDRPKLLHFIAKQSSAASCVKWVVSSRNWPDIEKQLEGAGCRVNLSLELNETSVAAAVEAFIERKVVQLSQKQHYKPELQSTVLQHLTSNANGTFLWVALVCQSLQDTPKWNVVKRLSLFPPGLDSLYRQMVDQISRSEHAEICKEILASAAILYRPVTILELAALVEPLEEFSDDLESLREVIGLCGSFLTLQGDMIYFVHQSAQDFLLNNALGQIIPHGIEAVHQKILAMSLATLSKNLQRNMYRLEAPETSIDDTYVPNPDPLAASRYSCIYWIDHLCESRRSPKADNPGALHIGDDIATFISGKYLYWLEALSLCRSIAKGIGSMARLSSAVQTLNTERLTGLVRDAHRFIMHNKGVIEAYPLQTYASGLLFSPEGSLIRNLFQHEAAKIKIEPALGSGWSACLQTLEGHSSSVLSVAFSHDSTKLASASSDKTVMIWDASSGACLQTLEGHSNCVRSVAFSHDSTKLASASHDKTVKIWDASSGACLQILEGHSSSVLSVAFSHNSTKLASASHDKTVKVWDASSGACLQTLEGQNNYVFSVAFSHDSTKLASASSNKTVKIWDASSGACLQILEGHSSSVLSVAFSHDSTKLASASHDNTVKVWDASSGVCLQTLEGHSNYVMSVAFSHDSTKLASASLDETVKIWDASSGACLQILEGHNSSVFSVAFSHESTKLVSASGDETVKVWDTSSGACLQILEGHSSSVLSVGFSHDSTNMASASLDRTVKVWDASSGACLQTLKGHSDWVKSVAFSHDSTKLASASDDWTVKIWDTCSGECLQTLEGHINYVLSVTFSHDSTKLASASDDRTVKVWDTSSGACLQTLEGHNSSVLSVGFSHDSTKLASASSDKTVKIWDASSGACLQTLEDHSNWVWSVAFSHDSTKLASASDDKTVKIWDASSGACLQTLDVGRILLELSFNSTGSCLYTEAGSIAIDSSISLNTVDVDTAEPESPQYLGVGISSDKMWITQDGENTVWVPSEYRPYCSSVCKDRHTIGIGHRSGRVWMCSIDV